MKLEGSLPHSQEHATSKNNTNHVNTYREEYCNILIITEALSAVTTVIRRVYNVGLAKVWIMNAITSNYLRNKRVEDKRLCYLMQVRQHFARVFLLR